MKRAIEKQFKDLLDNSDNRGILLTGVRGVGKTYFCLDFVRSYFNEYLYIDAENDSVFQQFADEYLSADDKPSLFFMLSSYFGISEDRLIKIPIIIDEIKFSEALCRIICEDTIGLPQGSRLIMISSFSVNRAYINALNQIKLFPMGFDEFLAATGHEWYNEVIEAHITNAKKIPDLIHNEINELFEIYLSTGGMPQTVEEFIKYDDLITVNNMVNRLKENTLYHIVKCCALPFMQSEPEKIINENMSLKIYDSVAKALSSKNNKFMYNYIRRGITENNIHTELDMLTQEGILYRVDHMLDEKAFQLYYYDFSFAPKNTKAVYQNYIVQTLESNNKKVLYNSNENNSVLTFGFMEKDEMVLLIPEKKNWTAIRELEEHYNIVKTINLSEENLNCQDNKMSIPLYGLKYIKAASVVAASLTVNP